MCADYWTIRKATANCPKCGEQEFSNLQTHDYGGDDGLMCSDYYDVGEQIPALKAITGPVVFIAHCPNCKEFIDMAADLTDGIVSNITALTQDKPGNTT